MFLSCKDAAIKKKKILGLKMSLNIMTYSNLSDAAHKEYTVQCVFLFKFRESRGALLASRYTGVIKTLSCFFENIFYNF